MFRVLTFAAAVVVVFAGMTTVFPILESEVDPGISSVAVAGAPIIIGSEEDRPARVPVLERPKDKTRPSCILSSKPATVARGEQVSIAWGSENTTVAWLSGVGAVLPEGGMYVRPFRSGAYTLTVRSAEGRFGYCRTWITVR
ncbi:hypothetical protein C4556_03430 [Candidatus Parcubacteria bacterium]|nr:MAG: hypothetical protein C4556_03430 [Candidatus Parcubacteria bacterium]